MLGLNSLSGVTAVPAAFAVMAGFAPPRSGW